MTTHSTSIQDQLTLVVLALEKERAKGNDPEYIAYLESKASEIIKRIDNIKK